MALWSQCAVALKVSHQSDSRLAIQVDLVLPNRRDTVDIRIAVHAGKGVTSLYTLWIRSRPSIIFKPLDRIHTLNSLSV